MAPRMNVNTIEFYILPQTPKMTTSLICKGMFYKDYIIITSTKSSLQVTKEYFDLSTVNQNIYRDRI